MKTKKRLKKISLIVLLISIVLLAILIVYAQGLRLILIKSQTQKDYPTGCESVSTVMALNYANYDINIDTFIDKYLDIGEYYKSNGEYYGSNPNEYFIGNPRDDDGFGCYAPTIYKAVEKITGNNGVINLTGSTLEELCSQYIDHTIPVIVWATQDMQPSKEGKTWKIIGSNEQFTWKTPEHCLLLVGYDSTHYYFNDPQSSHIRAYNKQVVELRYQELGRQAIAILPKN